MATEYRFDASLLDNVEPDSDTNIYKCIASIYKDQYLATKNRENKACGMSRGCNTKLPRAKQERPRQPTVVFPNRLLGTHLFL